MGAITGVCGSVPRSAHGRFEGHGRRGGNSDGPVRHCARPALCYHTHGYPPMFIDCSRIKDAASAHLQRMQSLVDEQVRTRPSYRRCGGAVLMPRVPTLPTRNSASVGKLLRRPSTCVALCVASGWLCLGSVSPDLPHAVPLQISFELYRDPVVAPSGHVYERRCLMDHLGRSATDPLTRAPLTAKQVYPCHPLRHAAKDFLDKFVGAAPPACVGNAVHMALTHARIWPTETRGRHRRVAAYLNECVGQVRRGCGWLSDPNMHRYLFARSMWS